MTEAIRRGSKYGGGMKQSQELSNLKSSDEDYFDSIFGFDDHALENLSDDLIIIADWVIRQRLEDYEDFVEPGFCVFTFLLCICDAIKLDLQLCFFVHESLGFFFVEGFHLISGNGFEHLLESRFDLCNSDLKVEAVIFRSFCG